MSSYKALYRKYRPDTFEDVKDQFHITRTLRNAINSNKVSHAYLFSGPRGIGKTTIAKIFAKAINCLNPIDGEPCNKCESCIAINSGSTTDILEIDAASNNGVDEIRDLRDKVKFLPSLCKYKVYIIDEVHMLTNNAFNALLKTLEEPPQHAVFILCTTDLYKVIPTIQSRCQKFDFYLIQNESIVDRLRQVSSSENINITDEALNIISEVSEGGMRDALSLLDQVIAFSNKDIIDEEDVLAVSGKMSTDTLISIANKISNNEPLEAISLLDQLVSMGKEISKISQALIVFFKDILVMKNTTEIINKSGYSKKEFKDIINYLDNDTLFSYIDILIKAQGDMKFSSSQRLYLELAFLKMSDLFKVKPIEKDIVREPILEAKPLVHEEVKEDTTVKEPSHVEESTIETKKEESTVTYVDETLFNNIEEIKEEPVLKEEAIVEVKKEETPSINDDKTYDISLIEKILNQPDKPFKESIILKWNDFILSLKNGVNYQEGKLLEDCEIKASNGQTLIITFNEVGICNLIMKPGKKETIKSLLKNFFNLDLDYIAIPLDLWDMLSLEFVKVFRKNRENNDYSYIPLSYIPYKNLRILGLEEEVKEKDKYSDFFDAFKDVINVK